MPVRGWVYVITNKAMPDLVKVGYSTKDPEMRAKELENTGAPHGYVVEFDVLVENPRGLEQKVHTELSSFHERKEWFRCSVSQAIAAIKTVSVGAVLLERKAAEVVEISTVQDYRYRLYQRACKRCGSSFAAELSDPEPQIYCPQCVRLWPTT